MRTVAPWIRSLPGVKHIVHAAIAVLPLPIPTRFVVITAGRTGSNLLLSLLDSHPRVRIAGEVLGEYMMQQPPKNEEMLRIGPPLYVKKCFNRTRFESVVGIKILYYQVEEDYRRQWGIDGLGDAMDFLTSQRDIRIIHLKRRNRLKTLTSLQVARVTQRYQEYKGPTEQVDCVRVSLSTDECQQNFGRIGRWERLYDDTFEKHKVLEVTYENLVADPRVECNRILDFLSVSRRALTTSLKKQRTRTLSEVIENYDELQEHFAGTAWAHYFEQ